MELRMTTFILLKKFYIPASGRIQTVYCWLERKLFAVPTDPKEEMVPPAPIKYCLQPSSGGLEKKSIHTYVTVDT